MIRYCLIIIVSVLFFGKISTVEAQMVNVRLVLPAGVNFNPRIIEAKPKGGETGLRWVEMVVQENIHLTVSLKSDYTGKDITETLYVLNNGTVDFRTATKHEAGEASFQFDNRGMLIRNTKPKVQQIRAWLGIPILPGIITAIEYH
ncbi:hypothetical protein MMU07_12145 [Aquiflexum sp. LQ15W]|uniref:hypothetical protein n=1 Tax=Cognataquiflexum nitidum TaxID=2922272 RepID=UPI001F145809|nr:hypothetical protein [Cognataquiflexum nitidum]MCH6200333.1 hypothetical protein [Cognataquiflexum nitidum]